MGIRISKDHLHPSVIESITSLIGDLDQLETTAKGNAVEAINELLANGGNKEELEDLVSEIADGKELIANAVGEPLTAEDSFDEMSNDINSLLSTFKTNMMNNGVTVESGDKFKQLIDKIATMVEEGSGKGIQYAEGVYDGEIPGVFLDDSTMTVTHTLGSIPTIIFVSIEGEFCNDFHGSCTLQNVSFNSITCSSPETACKLPYKNSGYYNYSLYISEINDANFTIHCSYEGGNYSDGDVDMVEDGTIVKWYAIGVGEEDTTLRDSLASILQEEGVNVTEEDDMASLITKVDSELAKLPSNNAEIQVYSASGIISTGYNVVGGGNGFKPTYNGTLSYHIENPSLSYKISFAIDIIQSDTGETERVIEDTVDASETKIGKLSFKANDTIKVLAKCSSASISVNVKFLLNVLILD